MENHEIVKRNDELFTALKKHPENTKEYQEIVSEIVKNNQPLVKAIAKKYFPFLLNPTTNGDDLIQEAYSGLLSAIKYFNPGKVAFSTFAMPCIKNSIRAFLKRERRYQKLSSENNKKTYKSGDEQKLEDILAAPINIEEEITEQDEINRQMAWVRNHLDWLKPQQKEVLTTKYLLGEASLKGDALAEEFGLGRQRISAVDKEAIAMLKNMYSEETAMTREEKAEKIKLKEILKNLIATELAPQQKKAMLCKYYSATPKTTRQVAEELNLKANNVDSRIAVATEKLCKLCDSIKDKQHLKSILEFRIADK